eukprot:g2801.t1
MLKRGLDTAIKKPTYRKKHDWRSNTVRGTKRMTMHKYAMETLGAGNVAAAVKLPPGEDLEEWLAMHVVDLYNETSLLFSTIMDKCTDVRCPKMSAGKKFEYLWADHITKKPCKVSAPKYVDLLMTWIEDQLNDESIFPTRVDTPFPKNFRNIVAKIMQRLFRVYSHIYHEHFRDILALNAPAHLNSAFKRFVLFTREFKLLSKRDYAPLQDLIDKKLDNKGLKKGHHAKKKVDSVGVPKYMLSAKQPIKSPLPKKNSKPTEPPIPPTEEEEDDEKSGGLCLVM